METSTPNQGHDQHTPLDPIIGAQLRSLDDTDTYASAWAEALSASDLSWGGRGRGGRGLARRTWQPHDVILDGVSLEYLNDPSVGGGSKILLDGATLKLLSQHVYAVVGRNGCGKSTLLRRIDANKIPGMPPRSTLYVPQEVLREPNTPMEMVIRHHKAHAARSKEANQSQMEQLEKELDALDVSSEENAAKMENLCEQISSIEEEVQIADGEGHDAAVVRKRASEALNFFGINENLFDTPAERLSGGQRKKVLLACALFCMPDILMLDEPTNHLDIAGIMQLRCLIGLCVERKTTVMLVSHDVDLINDCATDVIHFFDQKLTYYPGNYRDFVGYKNQKDAHKLRQNHALEKQRAAMMNTIDNLKKQSFGKRGDKKKQRAIESRKKKLEKHGIEKDEHGHRFRAQTAGTGIREGSINSIDASTRKKLSHTQLLKRGETNVAPVPDKAVQFVFRDTGSTWGEPLIMAMDVGHGYSEAGTAVAEARERRENSASSSPDIDNNIILRKDGMLFDCVDLCIDEGSTTCILGANGSGKSTLLRILAGVENPLEGKVHHALNVNVGYFDQHVADDLIENADGSGMVTALSLMTMLFPLKTEQDLRGELTSFGLNPKQAATNVKFLSGGERCRLCLAVMMLRDPQVLVLDEPTNHLDVESVEALTYGIKKWNGTVVMVSHDANLVRSLDGSCYVLMEDEGKLRRIQEGIDSYLKAFKLRNLP